MQKTQLNDMNLKNDTTDRPTVQLEILAPIKEVAIIPTSHSALTSASCNTSHLSIRKQAASNYVRLHGVAYMEGLETLIRALWLAG